MKKLTDKDPLFLLMVLFLGMLLIIFTPLLFIWSANTLFPTLEIDYSFKTWLATVFLGMFFRGWDLRSKGND